MTESPQESAIRTALAGVLDPAVARIGGITVQDGRVSVALEIDPRQAEALEPQRLAAERAVAALPGVVHASAVLTAARTGPVMPTRVPASVGANPGGAPAAAAAPGGGKKALEGVRHIIAVASGKGGVGKSTTAANLALALAGMGQRVGILDADIYGPSMQRVLGVSGKPDVADNKMLPKQAHGLKVMSMGFLIAEDQAMIWRGPMVMGALTQMLREVAWAPLDILVLDMPPGTGDAQLTIAQGVPLSGAVIVSTPQDLALIDAARGVTMFQKVAVPILGLIENMSYFVCPNCNHESHIFGHGGAATEAARLGTDFLGEIPLDIEIRRLSDDGRPIVIDQPDSPHTQAYKAIAAKILAKLESGSASRPAPRIVIE
jgi:ATP-binding protein involved in chromosome partitioning